MSKTVNKLPESVSLNPNIEQWFDGFIATIRTHQVQLETNTIKNELKEFYNNAILGKYDEVMKASKTASQQYFVGKIIVEYLQVLNNTPLNKLAFNFNDSEILVWAEIEDDRDDLEKKLILTEAKINAKYHQFGFDMSTTIVEKSDRLKVPNHYKVVH